MFCRGKFTYNYSQYIIVPQHSSVAPHVRHVSGKQRNTSHDRRQVILSTYGNKLWTLIAFVSFTFIAIVAVVLPGGRQRCYSLTNSGTAHLAAAAE
jgi:hypothetical protein